MTSIGWNQWISLNSVANKWKPLVFFSFCVVSLENHWFSLASNTNQWNHWTTTKKQKKRKPETLFQHNPKSTQFHRLVSQTLFFLFSNGFHWFVLETNENQWFSNETRQKLMKTNGFHWFATEFNENHWFQPIDFIDFIDFLWKQWNVQTTHGQPPVGYYYHYYYYYYYY